MRWTALLVAAALACSAFAKDTAPAAKPTRVVYLIDGSGSMKGEEGAAWIATITEVAKSLDAIGDGQMFGVLLMTSDRVEQVGPAMLMKPTEDNKQLVWDVLKKHEPKGMDRTPEGITLAAKRRPDLVWFVSDGSLKDPDESIAAIKKTATRRFKVNTLAVLVTPNTATTEADLKTLKQIANATGGQCVGEPTEAKKKPEAPKRRPQGPSIFD